MIELVGDKMYQPELKNCKYLRTIKDGYDRIKRTSQHIARKY